MAGGETISERDRDLLIRTLYGEANGQPPRGQAAVVHVILNRMAADGYPSDAAGVVLQRGQFEPWAKRRGELTRLPVTSRAYQEAAQTVDDVLAGNVPDPTGGATHFFSPGVQAAFGRRPPSWARDPLASIGGHVFYAPNGRVERPALIAPPEPGTPATLEEAGISPRGASSPAQPKAPTMPKDQPASSDDDVMALYGLAPASGTENGKASAPAAKAASKAPAPPAGDDVMALYSLTPDASAKPQSGSQTAAGAAPAVSEPAAAVEPVAVPGGIADARTGEVVVGGKPFTGNRSGLWAGFQNLADGALLGAGVPLAAGAAALKEKLTNGGDLGSLYTQARAAYGGAQEQYRQQSPGTALATELAGSVPTTIAATMAGGAALGAGGNLLLDAVAGSKAYAPLAAAGQIVTGGAGKGGNLLTRAFSQGMAGAGAGAFGGAINTGLTGGGITDNALSGAMLGGGVGAALPVAGAAVGNTFNKLTGSASPEVAALAQTARDTYGIPLRAAQISDSAPLKFIDSTLSRTPGMGYGAAERGQQIAVNRAVAQTFGETAERITPSVMQAAKTRLGQTFDKVAAGSWVRADNQFAGDLQRTFDDAAAVLTDAELKPLQGQVKGLLAKFDPKTGEMEGNAYQALTRKGAPLDRAMSSDNPNVRYYAGQIRDALDGALERSAPAELVDELRQARRQYKNLKTIEDLAGKSTTGDISPAALMQAVQRSYGGSVAYQGGGELGDLARIGQRFLKEPPSSGTAERLAAKDTLGTLAKAGQLAGGAAGAAMGLNHFAPQIAAAAPGVAGPAIAGAAASFGAGRLASSVLRSEGLANRLIERGLGTAQAGPFNRLMSLAGDVAPETAAPIYNRSSAPVGANDNKANRLDEFLANRPINYGPVTAR